MVQIVLAGLALIIKVVHQKEVLATLEVLLEIMTEIVGAVFLHLSIFVLGIFVPRVVAGTTIALGLVLRVRPK